MPSQTSQTSQTSHAQKLVRLVRLETSQTRHTSFVENTGSYVGPKTSFKTNTEKFDDEAAPLARALAQAESELTGKVTSDALKWEELASVLVTELKIAAGRTTISSVPAFLAEHLRRRLFKKDKAQLEFEEKSSPAPATLKTEASQCPDCKGVGMWYPEGFEKGVARCRHEKLGAATAEGS